MSVNSTHGWTSPRQRPCGRRWRGIGCRIEVGIEWGVLVEQVGRALKASAVGHVQDVGDAAESFSGKGFAPHHSPACGELPATFCELNVASWGAVLGGFLAGDPKITAFGESAYRAIDGGPVEFRLPFNLRAE